MKYEEFLRECDIYESYMKSIDNGPAKLQVFYRGQADDWEIRSSLQRAIKAVEGKSDLPREIKEGEKIIFSSTEIDRRYTSFEYLARMQHYNENPTRLIDYTESMDIALFFSCSDQHNMDKDGVVYCCSYIPRNIELCDVEIMMELSLLSESKKLEDFLIPLLVKYPEYSKTELGLKVMAFCEHGFMVAPNDEEKEKLKTYNPRMYYQKGAFFVQGNKMKCGDINMDANTSTMERNIPFITVLNELADVPNTITKGYVKKITIPHENKKELLSILDNKGINEQSLGL